MPNSVFVEPLVVLAAYLIGGLSPGWLMARRAGVDLRHEGSGVTGATNAARVLGKSAYGWVLALDALKGWAVVELAERWAPGSAMAALTAPAVVAGHIWPVWLAFRGGRGAATLMGVCIGFDPWIVLLAWIPGLLAGISLRKGFAARAVAFVVSLPIGWFRLRGPAVNPGFPASWAQLGLLSSWVMVLLAHRGHFGKQVAG